MFIGECLSALRWAGIWAGYIANCYNEDSPFHPLCVRALLNVGYRGGMSGVSRQDRLEHAVRMVLGALLHGENVLVHCFRGRHRSGAFVIFCLALIMGWDLETARAECVRRQSDFTPKDHAILGKVLMHKGGLQWILEDMRGQDWCQHAVKVLVNLSRAPRLRGPMMTSFHLMHARACRQHLQIPWRRRPGHERGQERQRDQKPMQLLQQLRPKSRSRRRRPCQTRSEERLKLPAAQAWPPAAPPAFHILGLPELRS